MSSPVDEGKPTFFAYEVTAIRQDRCRIGSPIINGFELVERTWIDDVNWEGAQCYWYCCLKH